MGNDQDRLQQLEDNFNAGDSIYQALGLQQNTMRKLARQTQLEREQEIYDTAIDYYLGEGYTEDMAEMFAERDVKQLKKRGDL